MVKIIQPLLSQSQEEALKQVLKYLEDEEYDFFSLPPEERGLHIFHDILTLRGLIIPNRFDLGKLCTTPGAAEALERANQQPWDFLTHHRVGDWGDVCNEDWKENEFALGNGLRLFSVYHLADETKIWIITEADRSVTTILLPEEY